MAGPTPVSALIHAATMVVAGIYMVARLYPVFFEGLSIGGRARSTSLAVVGGVTTLFGGVAGLRADTTSRRCWPTRRSASSATWSWPSASAPGPAAIFHLFTHAFFKACLFLGAGSVSHACHHTLRHEGRHGRPAEEHAEDVLDVPHRARRPRRHLPAGRLLVEGRDPGRRRQPGQRATAYTLDAGHGPHRRLHDRAPT